MFCVFKGVPTLTVITIGLFAVAIDPLEGYQPLIQLSEAPFVHYTNPVFFQNPPLTQPYPLAAAVEANDDSSSNIVNVLIHKDIKVQPNGLYSGITGETTRIVVPREETENIENSSEREVRRIKPANSFSGYKYNVPQNSFREEEVPLSQNYEQEAKTETQPQDSLQSKNERVEHTNAHGGDSSKEELEEDGNSYETSEEIAEDQPSGYSYKKGNTKKDLQRDFFRSPAKDVTSEFDEPEDSDVKPTDKSPNLDIELLHTISEQFVLSNGKLTHLNASDFTELSKENDKSNTYYNYNVDEKSEEKYKPESRYNSSESLEPLHSSEERQINEETEEYSAPSTENNSFDVKEDDHDEREYHQVVKNVIQKQILQLRPQRKNVESNVQFQNNFSARQVTPKPNYEKDSTDYKIQVQNSPQNQQPMNSIRQKLNLVRQLQSYNQEPSNSTYNIDTKNVKTPSPSYGYNSPSESQQQQAEADELSVFLFDAPRFSALHSANPTQQTYNEIPASYTRRPLKLQRDPLIKSHYDRTLYQNVGNTISTRPTKSSRTLDNQDNNQWHPVTSRSTIQPEKLRQINSLARTNSKFQHGSKSSRERITPSFQSFSSAINDTKGNYKSGANHPVSIQDIISNQKDEFGSESKEGINLSQSAENGNANRPLFSLIDELTGVIQKHKDAATSSEELLTKSNPQNSLTTHKERFYSTEPPPQLSTVRNNQHRASINLPRFKGDTNVNQFGNLAPSPSSQNIPSHFRDTRTNATSSNQIQTQLTISNSTINHERQKKNEKLYYYGNDSRGTTPSPSGRIKFIMPVRPYVPHQLQEGRRNKAKSPFHAFLNSLHALREKNKNRHSHVHELLVNSLNLRKQKSSPPENVPDTRSVGFKLTPSIYSAVPVYKAKQIPFSQSPYPGERQRPQFIVTPINPEVEVIDQANRNRGAPLEGGYSQSQVVPVPVAGRSRPIKSQDTDTKPKEYLGDTYARLGENLFYRVHHIFKQFVPPVLHIGSDEPPK